MKSLRRGRQLTNGLIDYASRDDLRTYRVAAVGIRSDGTVVRARNESTVIPTGGAHAEARLVRKLDRGSKVFVVRVRKDGTLAMAKPCSKCQPLLKNYDVWYSNDNGEMEKL